MRLATLALGLSALALSTVTHAAPTELVTNGSFEADASGGVQGLGGNGSTGITGWTLNDTTIGGHTSYPLAWYYPAGTADNNNVTAQVYGPGNGVANGFGLSPDGGAMVALDGAFTYQASLSQQLSGLTPGKQYTVKFFWSGGQQAGFGGTTTEQFAVSLGNQSKSTGVWNNPEKGFSGWFSEKYTFTAQTANDVLSFLAVGTPDGQPPFSLIDGVSVTASVPEAGTLALLGFGGLGLAAVARRRK